jgi:hypothetical protein
VPIVLKVVPVVPGQIARQDRLVRGGIPRIRVGRIDPGVTAHERDVVEELKRRVLIAAAVGVALVTVRRVDALSDADLGDGPAGSGGIRQRILEEPVRRDPAQPVTAGRGIVVDVERRPGPGDICQKACRGQRQELAKAAGTKANVALEHG